MKSAGDFCYPFFQAQAIENKGNTKKLRLHVESFAFDKLINFLPIGSRLFTSRPLIPAGCS
jgi:hypothetical protein